MLRCNRALDDVIKIETKESKGKGKNKQKNHEKYLYINEKGKLIYIS